MPAGPIEWVHAFIALVGSMLPIGLISGKTIKDNRDRSRRNKRQLEGDPNDPNSRGVLQIAHETYDRVEEVDRKVDQVRHEAKANRQLILSKLNEMDEDAVDDFEWQDEAAE